MVYVKIKKNKKKKKKGMKRNGMEWNANGEGLALETSRFESPSGDKFALSTQFLIPL